MGSLATRFFIKLWNSPVMMTWASFAARSLGLVIVFPLLLTSLSTSDIALWFLFQTVISLRILVDLGFTPTFTRLTAFAMGGANADELRDMRVVGRMESPRLPNGEVLGQITAMSHRIYLWMALCALLILASFGTWSVARLVIASTNVNVSWIAWTLIVLVSPLSIYGNRYRSYLQGTDHIAVVRRWEAVFALLGIFTSFVILVLGGEILALSIGGQFWATATFFRNRLLAHRMDSKDVLLSRVRKRDLLIWQAVWPSAWRSGLTVLIHRGIVAGSGILYAQFGDPSSVASFLLALRLAQFITEFSQAPFYTKIPRLARLRAAGKIKEQLRIAERFMRLSYFAFSVPFVVLGLFGDSLFALIGSNAQFPDTSVWCLFSLAFFFERYGAMHIQLYSTTNHIITHIANGITGVIWIGSIYVLLPLLGALAFPLSFLIGNVGFYAWYSAFHSYSAYPLGFVKFESRTSVIPFILLLAYCLFSAWNHG